MAMLASINRCLNLQSSKAMSDCLQGLRQHFAFESLPLPHPPSYSLVFQGGGASPVLRRKLSQTPACELHPPARELMWRCLRLFPGPQLHKQPHSLSCTSLLSSFFQVAHGGVFSNFLWIPIVSSNFSFLPTFISLVLLSFYSHSIFPCSLLIFFSSSLSLIFPLFLLPISLLYPSSLPAPF